MIFSTTTIIICAILLLLAVIAPLSNPFFRRIRLSENAEYSIDKDSLQQQLPPVSIIVTAHNNAAELERNLPHVLNQQYTPDYQVIVVAEKGDLETENVLKRLSADKRLYYTLIPESSRYMSRKKLSITIGVKAAKYEWILMTDPTCRPISNYWLATMARNCNNKTDLVIGYTTLDTKAHLYQRFENFQTECYSIYETQHNISYRHSGANLMLRKSIFMKQDGFLTNLHLVRGEYDFLVNDMATKNNVATETSIPAHVCQEPPTHKAWVYQHLYYIESRKILKHSFNHRLLFNIDQLLLHLSAICYVSAIVISATTAEWIITCTAALSVIITAVLRSCFLAKQAKAFGEHIPYILALPLQISVVWHNAKYYVKYRFADKLDFTTHKL